MALRRKTVLLLTLAALLCGCAGKPAADSSASRAEGAAPATAATPPDARPVLVCFGDSLTAGFGLDANQSYPEVLQRELDRRGLRYRVVNMGVSGETTQDGIARLPLVLAEKPAVVVLEFGANDGLRGQPVGGIETNLAQMINALQGAGARVILAGITLPPNYGETYLKKFDAIYPELASKYKIRLIPFLLAGVGGNPALMQRDGLHPNAEGAKIVAQTVLKALQ